jgi:transcriptional regulator of aromatic amino acid metabolism
VPEHAAVSDDAIAALLDREATAASVQAALTAAVADGADLLAHVVASWLDLAEELGRPPSSREVAPRAGVSHTTVNTMLRELRGYFPTRPSGTSS